MVELTVEGLEALSLVGLTDIYNSMTGRHTARLKCSKAKAVKKIMQAYTLVVDKDLIEDMQNWVDACLQEIQDEVDSIKPDVISLQNTTC